MADIEERERTEAETTENTDNEVKALDNTDAKKPDLSKKSKTGDKSKKDNKTSTGLDNFKIRFPLRNQIIWFIVSLIVIIILFVYQTTLKDEKKELINQMELRGGAISKSFANSAMGVLTAAISTVMGDLGLTKLNEKVYENIDYFELGLSENAMNMLAQQDVIYAYIINPYNKILSHSDKNILPLSDFKFPPGLKSYKELYKTGDLVEPIIQRYKGEYVSPYDKEKKLGEIIDISFPLKLEQEKKSLKTYQGEVHIGMTPEGIIKVIQNAKGKLLNVAFLAVFLGIIGAYLLAFFVTSPIKKLVSAMHKVASGDLNQSVKIKRKDEIGMLATSFNFMTEGLREKERIKNTFNKFVSEEIANEVLSGEDKLKLGGEYKEVTMFFSDIRSFTSMSEKMEPHEIVSLLNEYLSLMTDIIIANKGVIDKYVGDEIMAVFGAPIKHDNDAELAVKSAVENIAALKQLNEKNKALGKKEIQIGIGINTGLVISGNMGSEKHMDYTVIGDNVNLASRLCDSAGKNGLYNILITESTFKLVKDKIIYKEVEPIKVKGKEKPIKIYEVYDMKNEEEV